MTDQTLAPPSDEAPRASALVLAYKKRNLRRVALVLAATVLLACLVVLDFITGPANLSFGRSFR